MPMQSKDGVEQVGSNLESVFASIPIIGLKCLCAHFRFHLCTSETVVSFYINVAFDRFYISIVILGLGCK